MKKNKKFMRNLVCAPILGCVVTILNSSFALAHGGPADSVYYVGEQGADQCYVEASYAQDGMEVDLRTLIIDEHDGELVGVDTIEAQYSATDSAYLYTSPTDEDEILSLELVSTMVKNAESLTLVLNHGDHPHPIFCENLVKASGTDLMDVEAKFDDFDTFLEKHDQVSGDDHDDHSHKDHDH